jgi:hypothetical protein
VGTSGSPSYRVAVVTANGRNLPALICSIVRDVEPNKTCTCPPSKPLSTPPIFVWYVHHVDSSHQLEWLARDVRRDPDPG